MADRQVVVTGIGMISPCGAGWEPYWETLLKGESRIQYLPEALRQGFSAKLGGMIRDFNPSDYVKQRKLLKVMSREIQLAVAASTLAMQDAGLPAVASEEAFRYGISLGTGIINNDLDEIGVGIRSAVNERGNFDIGKFGRDGISALYPLWFLKYLPNMPACHISITHGFRGPSNTITTSAAAGAQAVGEAFHVIRRGDADVMLAGGADSKINAMGLARFHSLGLLASRNGVSPEKVYCPFDKRRDGMVVGEGASLLVLEEKAHAFQRGARIYGEICGYGSSSDFNYDPTNTDDYTGKYLAMDRALHAAQVDIDDVRFILANGSGVPQDDIQEAKAIHAVFKSHLGRLKVTAVKPITGHLIYGAGSMELAAGILSLYHKMIPPVINYEVPDPDCDLPFVRKIQEDDAADSFLLNSFGFGGQNASLVVRQ